MKSHRLRETALVVMALAAAGAAQTAALAAGPAGTAYEALVTPGANYDKAEFRLWLPAGVGTVRAVVVLVPGSNGDGRPMADDPVWRDFAARRGLALMACRFTDKPHDQNFIEEYAAVSRGSGQALLDALAGLGDRLGQTELGSSPLLLWGMSAGRQNSTTNSRPGSRSWSPPSSSTKAASITPPWSPRRPGKFRACSSRAEKTWPSVRRRSPGYWRVNRRAGALWAIAEEPGVTHAVGRSIEMSLIFFDEVLPLRLGPAESEPRPGCGL